LSRARALGPWIPALALVAGAGVARLLVHLLPAGGADVEAARALGISSVSILAGHSKSAESLAYAVALASALATSVGIWLAWSRATGGRREVEPVPLASRARVSALELLLVAAFLGLVFAHAWNARAAWVGTWVTLAEEGEALAWIDTVLRGGALSRDVFCLYGPLSTWAPALVFRLFGPSLGLWRSWIFALNAGALFAAYLLLRQMLRTRIAALVATILVGAVCGSPIPAMSWSLSRVGLGLAALSCLARSRADSGRVERWSLATGALLAVSLAYSQEVGVACSVGAGASLLLARTNRARSVAWTAAGGALVLAPCIAWLAARGALAATIDNLFLFPRIRLLGFGAFPFPELALSSESLRVYYVPAVLVVSGFSTATKLLRGDRSGRALAEVALFVFGALLFSAALSRPDGTHLLFAAPPALVLLAGLVEDACFALASPITRPAAAAGLALAALSLAPWTPGAATKVASLAAATPPGFRALELPRGGGALLPEDVARDLEAIVREIQSRTAPDEPFWVFPNEALLYFLADRPQPTRFPLALFAVTRAQRLALVDELERARPRWAVVYRYAAVVDGIGYDVALPEVLAYLETTYELEGRFGAFALLRRKS
jgi:hypothetical protein